VRLINHIIKILFHILLRPYNSFKWLIDDFNKDISAKFHSSKVYAVWCAGLPKSGTTLVEEIFDQMPYVTLNNSFLRIFWHKNLKHQHNVNEGTFKGLKKNHYSFLKTHSHYKKNYDQIIKKNNLKVIVSLRDLRDMMISRYFHILNQKNHWLHNEISSLNFKKGFKISLISKHKEDKQNAICYYYNWIKKWREEASKNKYLVVWYEDYKHNPINYIKRIMEFTEFENLSPKKVYLNILKKKRSNNLTESYKKFGKLKSTFRKGATEEWKEYFDDEISKYFIKNLPGSLDIVSYKKSS